MSSTPLKRSTNLVSLSHDHHDGLLFCWKLRQGLKKGASADRMEAYVRYFWVQHLEPHFDAEEHILFAAVEDDLVLRALEEHRQIRKAVGEMSVAQLADLVESHIRYEERDLFPLLERTIGKEQLETIGAALTRAHPAGKDDFPDNFWIL